MSAGADDFIVMQGDGTEGASHPDRNRLLVEVRKGAHGKPVRLCPCAIQKQNIDKIWRDLVCAGLMLDDPVWTTLRMREAAFLL